jgi:hypothetical protein
MPSERSIEHLLVIGWNAMGTRLPGELDQRAAPGSTVEIVYDSRLFDEAEIHLPPTAQFEVSLSTTTRLARRLAEAARADELTSIVLLGYRRGLSAVEADSRTLLNLMLLNRDLGARAGTSTRVIVELLDADNINLPQGRTADDYVVSDAIVGRIMAQTAEQPRRREVMTSLYAAEGPRCCRRTSARRRTRLRRDRGDGVRIGTTRHRLAPRVPPRRRARAQPPDRPARRSTRR